MRSSNILEVLVNHNGRKGYISKLGTLPGLALEFAFDRRPLLFGSLTANANAQRHSQVWTWSFKLNLGF